MTLNFVNADIEAVSRAIGAMLDRQLLVDPRVKGQITVYSEQPLTSREAYLNYLAALRGLGFTVVEIGGLLKVVPEADAKLQTGTVSVGDVGTRGDQIITQIFRLNHENANNLVPVLRPLISPNNTINANPATTRWSSPTTPTTCSASRRSSRRWTRRRERRRRDAAASTRWPPTSRRWCSGWPIGAGGARRAAAAPGAAGSGSVMADARSNSLIVRAANPARAGGDALASSTSSTSRTRAAARPATSRSST